MCVSKCCRYDLCSRLCRACVARKRRRRPASAAELAPHVPLTTFILRRALIRRQPCLALSHCRLSLSFSLSILAVIHSLSHYSLTNTATSQSSALDDSHNTSIVGRRIAFQPQPQGIHTVNGQITPDPYPVLVRFKVASPSYGIINTP